MQLLQQAEEQHLIQNMKNKEIWDVANIYNIKLLLNFSLVTSIIHG